MGTPATEAAMIAEDLADEIEVHARYARQYGPGQLLKGLIESEHLETIRPPKFIPGNLIITKVQGEPRHLALITEPGVVLHASVLHKRVVRHGLPANWRVVCEFKVKAFHV